ncbi:MAG TPA: hypothetical protein VHK67_03990 [Rhabdochlamydiaceae bacterium]|jgi:hypothetical protein|nr:hypothetical protein [Rhabdochlamydiaceae bacterium]
MSTATNNYNLISLGYYGQTPKKCDYPKVLTVAKPQSTPQKPETYTEKWKRYAWTVLPVFTLIRPVGSVVTVISEMAKTAKSVNELVKHRSLYSVFHTMLNAGTLIATVITPASPLLRTLLLGIQLLSLAHQAALKVYRCHFADANKVNTMTINVVSNILAIASMVFQNTLVISIFFLVQAAAAARHALKQLSKEEYLSAGVDVVMLSLRSFQAGYLLYLSLNNYFKQIAVLQLQENARISQIEPREKIKEKLSPYEAKLRDLGGEHFLYFKQSGPQEKFLILTAEADHNGALDPCNIASLMNQLSKRFDVKFRTITCVDDIQREIQNATQFGRVMGLLINAHGHPVYMHLSNNPNTGWLDIRTITAELFTGLDPSCVIALYSCLTASLPYYGVAYRVANLAKRVTYATSGLPRGITLNNLDPLEFSFEKPGIAVKTKKIEPLENDSFMTFLKSFFK